MPSLIKDRFFHARKGESFTADVAIYLIVGFMGFITVWPFLYIFSMSISSQEEVLKQSIYLFPKGFSIAAYQKIFINDAIWRSYANTIFYTLSGTFLGIITSLLGAYPLSKNKLFGRKFLVMYLIITMYVSGGLIPTFILMSKLGLYNNYLVMIIPGIVSIWNIILVRTFLKTIPYALTEAAIIDGASDMRILFKVMLPLSKPIIAVIALYTAVGIWNSWFSALIYLPDPKYHPIQLFLARVVVFNMSDLERGNNANAAEALSALTTFLQMKYAVIMFVSLPIICVYPFLQKYFLKGALIGSLKE